MRGEFLHTEYENQDVSQYHRASVWLMSLSLTPSVCVSGSKPGGEGLNMVARDNS